MKDSIKKSRALKLAIIYVRSCKSGYKSNKVFNKKVDKIAQQLELILKDYE